MRALVILLLLAADAAADTAQCPPGAIDRVEELLEKDRLVDAHLVAEVLATICPTDADAPRLRTLDAVALLRLDEDVRGRELLDGVDSEEARVLLAWSHLRRRDRDGYRRAAARLSAASRQRLDALDAVGSASRFRRATRDPFLLQAHDDYLDSRCKSPVFAGLLSAILPGAGQAYSGSWQGAAVAFVLNGILIGATVELARDEKYFSAGAVGLAASVFYVGNILNAADLAERANDMNSRPAYRVLEERLVPETR